MKSACADFRQEFLLAESRGISDVCGDLFGGSLHMESREVRNGRAISSGGILPGIHGEG